MGWSVTVYDTIKFQLLEESRIKPTAKVALPVQQTHLPIRVSF